MCGIAGFIGTSNWDEKRAENLLNAMLTRIQHRGPDECGLFLSPNASFGSVRLSIVDLATGQQPLCNADGNLWIAYNGEVFNYPELRAHLQQLGHRFKTNCDTEVVLHMYEQYGPSCLNMFNGQFAFCIWNIKEQTLFLARDRMGIRPLYYTQVNNQLVFASEIKAIFENPLVERRISNRAIYEVLTFWNTVSPTTFFDSVFELPAGNCATFKNGEFKVQAYWRLANAYQATTLKHTNAQSAGEELAALLKDSVKLRMRADVPVAAYLSGGLDSSVTTSIIKELFPDELNTFSIGFEEPAFDESAYQFEVAKYFNTKHHFVSFANNDVAQLLEQVLWHTEVPLLRTGPIPMYKLSKLVRNSGIKVVVTGEGADEALAGYNIFKETIIRHFWARYPDSKLRPLLLKKLYPYLPHINNASSSVLKMFFGYQLEQTNNPAYSHLVRWKNSGNLINLLNKDIRGNVAQMDVIGQYANSIADEVSGLSPLSKAQYIESSLFMSGYLLSSQGDRVSMGNSVEGRYPFLDYRVIEYCAQLPDNFKLNGLNEKYLLKAIMKGKLPQSVVNRPKQPYRAPIASALLNGQNTLMDNYLPHEINGGMLFFDNKMIANLLSRMNKAPQVSEIDAMALMFILSVQIIHRQFIQNWSYLPQQSIRKGVVRYAYKPN